MRPQLISGTAAVAQPHIALPGDNFAPGPGTAGLEQFPVQVQNPVAPGPLVQVVHVLGNYLYLEMCFQGGKGPMAGIGRCLQQLPAALVVKIQDQVGPTGKSLGGGNFHHVVTLPEPVCIAECLQTAVCAHPRTAQHYQFSLQLVIFKAARPKDGTWLKIRMDLCKLEYLEGFLSARRLERFREILANRTRYITVALEDVYQLHNASAVIRSCDVFGVQDAHLIEARFGRRLDKKIALGAQKWVDVFRYDTTETCIETLRRRGYRIVATSPQKGNLSPDQLPLDRPVALFFGTEKEGLSGQVLSRADAVVGIPMVGFTESLNISVAAAILLYQLSNRLRNSDVAWRLSEAEILGKRFDWAFKSVQSAEEILARFRQET